MESAISAHKVQEIGTGQYTLGQIFGIWLAAGVPMWVFGWLAYPALSQNLPPAEAGLLRIKLFSVGLIWQFVLAMIILYREEGNLRLSTISRRFWLNHPKSPKTGGTNKRLWWWLLPLVVLMVGFDLGFAGLLDELWVGLFPFLAEPESFSAQLMFDPQVRAQWIGAWDLVWWFLVMGIFNTFLGEEFLFRGILLPKMAGGFGRWDWLANGVMFAFYHLHQPWTLLGIIPGSLLLAFSARRFRSNWFPIILHSLQTVFFMVIILGLVLGLA